MTGSGKTGLGIVLLEEALLAGVPALILDPKGDMGNLLLAFPDLAPTDFRPWVNEDDARAAGMSRRRASRRRRRRTGRPAWSRRASGPSAIRALRDAADVTIYTPGSEAGVPLNVVGSLQAPPLSWETESETLRDEIEGTVTSLLGLIGIEADPLASREYVLLSNLIEHAWRAGRDLDLATLIGEVQAPPLRKLGVFDVDTFFPPKDRTELALRLNGLVASPAFAAWGAGRPARHRRAAAHARGQAARGDRLPRAPLRRGAPVRRHARAVQARHLDARPAGHVRTCARSSTWTRCSASCRRPRRRRPRSRS